MYSTLRSDSPQARSVGARRRSTARGVISPQQVEKRPHTDSAAFTEICCPTIERASVVNGSPRVASATRGCAAMMRAIVGSSCASERLARAQ